MKKDPKKLLSETTLVKISKLEKGGIKGAEKPFDVIEGEISTETSQNTLRIGAGNKGRKRR